jgi:hypothetical protein
VIHKITSREPRTTGVLPRLCQRRRTLSRKDS